MSRALRVIQISDCHVSADPQAKYRGVEPRLALESVLEAARLWRPDILLATGDLSEDGSPESYEYLSTVMAATGLPLLALPGNHDQPDRMMGFFASMPFDRPYVATTPGGWRIILVNSALVDNPSGKLAESVLSELAQLLCEDGDKPVLLGLHHQPFEVGSAWIDKYALKEGADRLAGLIDANDCVRAVVWGHIHSAFRSRQGGVLMLGAPSTVANSHPFEDSFQFDLSGPACRWLRLFDDGHIAAGILKPAVSGKSAFLMKPSG
jgi:Icc protein